MGNVRTIPADRVEVIEAWAAIADKDQTEGRGGQEIVAYCELEATAERLSRGLGVQGTDNAPRKVTLARIIGGHTTQSWLAPVNLLPPREDDRCRQDRLDKDHGIVARAKAAGLTDADIAFLRSGKA